jgi:hypothetical protein
MANFNTTNPEHLTYVYETLSLAVMGGIKTEGLHQLRCTLRLEHKKRTIRHSLDLYHNGQLEGFIRKAAQKLELGPHYVDGALNGLINELENYRLGVIANSEKATAKSHAMTEEEKAEALDFLKTPDLLLKTNELIGRSGVVGEELNRLIMYLIFTSRKMSRPLHVVSFGSSGAGKSHLQERVADCMPPEDVVSNTSLTGTALYYYEKEELRNKLLLFEDLDGLKEESLYAWRELMSKRWISRSMPYKDSKGNTKTKRITVHGPVCTAGCTTREGIYEDNANRCFLMDVDERAEQDKKIMDYQRAVSAGKINAEEEHAVRVLLQHSQRILQPVNVINPYAMHLQLPEAVFKPRRTNAHYLQFIEAITFYKQYQRTSKVDPQTGELYIETTLEDIAEANALMKHLLLRKADELSGATRNYLELLKRYLKEQQLTTFKTKDVRQHYRLNANSQKTHMMHLLQNGYLKKNEGNKKLGFTYRITDMNDYTTLEERIAQVLAKSLAEGRQACLLPHKSSNGRQEVMKLQEVVTPTQLLKAKPTKESTKRL